MMLAKFEEMSLISCMKGLATAVDGQDYLKMKEAAHSLKGASGYIGASHLHYACYFIQDHYMSQRYDQMMEYYPTVLEAAVEFRVYSRKLLADYNSNNIQ
jgi:HPt (histidine-containing phosphotransfer) domain-containing protein